MSKVHNHETPVTAGVSDTSATPFVDEKTSNQGSEAAFKAYGSEADAAYLKFAQQAWVETANQPVGRANQTNARALTNLNFEPGTEVDTLLKDFELVFADGDDVGKADTTGKADFNGEPEEKAKPPVPLDIPAAPGEPRKDLPANAGQEAESNFEVLKKRIEAADQIDPKKAINDVLEGQLHSINLNETLANPAVASKNPKPIEEVTRRIEIQKLNSYVAYLSPGTTRADLAFARIATGEAEQVKQGKKELVEALRLRPELQFNQEFQNTIELAFKTMAESRRKAGLGPLSTRGDVASSPESGIDTKSGTGTGSNTAGNTGAYETLADAGKVFHEKGMDASSELFRLAITKSDKLDHKAMTEQRLELFSKKLQLVEAIAEVDGNGKDTSELRASHKRIADREWDAYKGYLSPASVRTNTAMAMIASGSDKFLLEGKKLLAEAIALRPELEFSSDYQEHLKKAFQAHHQNKPATADGGSAKSTDGGSNQKGTADDGGKNNGTPNKQVDIKPEYKPFDGENKSKPVPEIANEPDLDPYLSDRLTGPILTAGLLYLGYRQVKSQYNRRLERVRVARLSDLLRSPDGESRSEEKATGEPTEVKPKQPEPGKEQADKTTKQQETAPKIEPKTEPKPEEPVRPKRRVVERDNLTRDGIEIAQDGTRTFNNAQGELAKLSWKERLTDNEMKELEKTRQDLERKMEKEGKLTKEESKQLDALRHFEKNKFDPKLHKKIVDSIAQGRPEGGFRARDAVGPVIGIAIITSAIISAYSSSRESKQEEPLKRAKFDK